MSIPRPKPRVTLREIARELNVSHATVSRALKDDPRISAPVRQQVRRMAQKMGYQPDPMLAALSHYRQGKIKHPITASLAWINHWPNPKQLRTYKPDWREAESGHKVGHARESARCVYCIFCTARLQPAPRSGDPGG